MRNYPNCYNIFVHAPEKERIKRILSRNDGANEREARDLAEKKNKIRAAYYNFYTDKDWGDAASYDLTVDSSILGAEDTANFIKDFILRKQGFKKGETNQFSHL